MKLGLASWKVLRMIDHENVRIDNTDLLERINSRQYTPVFTSTWKFKPMAGVVRSQCWCARTVPTPRRSLAVHEDFWIGGLIASTHNSETFEAPSEANSFDSAVSWPPCSAVRANASQRNRQRRKAAKFFFFRSIAFRHLDEIIQWTCVSVGAFTIAAEIGLAELRSLVDCHSTDIGNHESPPASFQASASGELDDTASALQLTVSRATIADSGPAAVVADAAQPFATNAAAAAPIAAASAAAAGNYIASDAGLL